MTTIRASEQHNLGHPFCGGLGKPIWHISRLTSASFAFFRLHFISARQVAVKNWGFAEFRPPKIRTTMTNIFVFLAKNWSRKNAKNTREVAYIFAFLAFSCGYSLWLRHKPRWVYPCPSAVKNRTAYCRRWPSTPVPCAQPGNVIALGEETDPPAQIRRVTVMVIHHGNGAGHIGLGQIRPLLARRQPAPQP